MNSYEKIHFRDMVREKCREILAECPLGLSHKALFKRLQRHFPQLTSSGLGVMLSKNCCAYFQRTADGWSANSSPKLRWNELQALIALEKDYGEKAGWVSSISLDAERAGTEHQTLHDVLYDNEQSAEIVGRY